ncbi:MAG: FKBP-type peptidyl-prolyl cis-trans isomerase [Bacteroidales bacterium]
MNRDAAMILLFLFFTGFFLISCEDNSSDLEKEKEMRLLEQYLELNNIQVEPESNGLYFIPRNEGSGITPLNDDWVIISYTGKLVNNTIFDSTDEEIARKENVYSSSVIYGDRRMDFNTFKVKGVYEGLRLMKEGAEATLIIPSQLGYGSESSGIVPPYSTLIYDIKLVKVIKDPVAYEQELIDDYISLYTDSTHLAVEEKESGIYYIELFSGTGDTTPGDSTQASIFYRGMLTDGREFDTNIGDETFDFIIGQNSAIRGFEEGVKLMKKDGKSRIIIPSSLGYGVEGSGNKIPGYTPLVFDLELTDFQ